MIKKILILVLISLALLLAYNYYPESELPKNIKIDSLIVIKSKRQLVAFSNGKIIKVFKISLGKNPKGAKQYEGDKRTPEGEYFINDKNPNSGYYKNLGISYPNEKDKLNNLKLNKPLGGDIKIHGLKNGLGLINKFQRCFDWTAGCIALTNKEIDELYNSVEIGTPIKIMP